jgi:hypothetical protein
MALQDPTAPSPWAAPPAWGEYIDQFGAPDPFAIAPPEPVVDPTAPPQQNLGPVLGQNPVPDEIANPNPDNFPIPPMAAPDGPPPIPFSQTPGNELEQLPLEVDAVSDADYKPPDGTPLGAAPMPTDVPLEQAAGRPEFLSDKEHGELLANEPAGDAMFRRVQEDKAFADLQANDALAASQANAKRQGEIQQIETASRERTRQALAQQQADVQKLADTDINQDGWMESRSTMQKIAAFAAVIGGGLVSGSTGGRNMGLEAIQGHIDQHIEIQKANLANKRAALGERRLSIQESHELDMQDARALETQRQAMYETTIRDMQAKWQQVDPKGTQARRYADAITTMRANQAASQEKWAQQDFENNLKLGEFSLKQDDNLLKRQQAEAKMRTDAAKAAAGGKAKEVKFDDIPRTAAELRQLGIPVEDSQVPPGGMSISQSKEVSLAGKAGEERVKVARENSPEEKARQHGVSDLVDVNGKTIAWREPGKVSDAYAASDDALRLYDELITLRTQYGGSTDLMRSPEWRQAQSKFSSLLLNEKTKAQLGALTGSDVDIVAKKIGTSDPTEWRDPLPGLKEGRHNLVEGMNAVLRAQAPGGVKPKRWDPPPPPPPAPRTPEQQDVIDLLKFDPDEPQNIDDASQRIGLGGAQSNSGLLPKYKKRIDNLISVFNNPKATEEDRKQAGAYLDEVKDKARSSTVRDYATSAAQAAVMSSIPVPSELE